MNKLLKVLSLGAVLGVSAPLALAAPITGQLTITGNDTFNATSISFSGMGSVGTSTISGINPGYTVGLISSFNYAPATFATPLDIYNTGGLSYYLTSITVGQDTAIPIPDLVRSKT